jgi:hypothetical protein
MELHLPTAFADHPRCERRTDAGGRTDAGFRGALHRIAAQPQTDLRQALVRAVSTPWDIRRRRPGGRGHHASPGMRKRRSPHSGQATRRFDAGGLNRDDVLPVAWIPVADAGHAAAGPCCTCGCCANEGSWRCYASLSIVESAGPGPDGRRHIPPALFLLALARDAGVGIATDGVITLPSSSGTIMLTWTSSGGMRATDVQPSQFIGGAKRRQSICAELYRAM